MLLFLFLFAMVISPMFSRILERMGYGLTAKIAAFITFQWMGFIFLCFSFFLLLQIIDIFSWGIFSVTGLKIPMSSGKAPTAATIVFITALCLYGYFTAWNIQLRHVHIETDKLPEGTDRLRIVQISDVHLGLLVRKGHLKKITDKVKSVNPDILVSTGDLVDGDIGRISELSELFDQISPKYGKYAVAGNHEFYMGLDYALELTRKLGFTVLHGKAITVNPLINIVGVGDHAEAKQEALLMSSVQNGLFTLFLKHKPIVDGETVGLFDLQLSGHTHGGQIFPFNFIVSIPFKYVKGFYKLPKDSAIYTNIGSGTWGPRIRIFCPPEVTVIELKRKLK
ncbi:MAG: metallophosphoesterase [Desulfobacteraceae bacterium]|nr:metallophosphoesterase [Desulfobacteraceae bacterium]